MKKLILGIITAIALVASNYLLSNLFKVEFLELSFLTGLLFTIVIGFFSSEGGFTTELTNITYKKFMPSENRTKDHFVKFHFNIPFIISLAYTIIFALVSLITYWKYF